MLLSIYSEKKLKSQTKNQFILTSLNLLSKNVIYKDDDSQNSNKLHPAKINTTNKSYPVLHKPWSIRFNMELFTTTCPKITVYTSIFPNGLSR